MKILLLGDSSNYSATLGRALAAAGHAVTVASNRCGWMQTHADIYTGRREGKIGGALLWLKLNTLLRSDLRGYDVVQLNSPGFVDLRPERLRPLYDRLRRENGAVFMTALGTDSEYVRALTSDRPPLRYSEWSVNGTPTAYAAHREAWLNAKLTDYTDYVYDTIDGVVSALYEYHVVCQRRIDTDRLAYAGIPVDIPDYQPRTPNDKLRIMIAFHSRRMAEKGINVMLPEIMRLTALNGESTVLDIVKDMPFEAFSHSLERADIVVDQLYSYTPATTALMAMARGQVVVSGGEEEYYRFIGEDRLRPIVNPDPEDMSGYISELQRMADDRSYYLEKASQGREFVEKHNSAPVVAARFVDFWERRLAR